jgi:hypothetical protein
MPFVPAPNIIQAEMRCTRDGQKIENRVMIDNLAVVDAGSLLEVATLVWDWWELTYAPLLPTTVTLNEVVTTDMSAIDGPQFTYAPDATTTGGIDGASLPNEVSLCVSLRSGNRGRSARGRFFFVGIPNTAMANTNNVSPTFAGNAASALQTLVNSIDTSGRLLVIVSYVSEGVPRVGGPVYYPVLSAVVVDTIVDSQRRRKPGVGA